MIPNLDRDAEWSILNTAAWYTVANDLSAGFRIDRLLAKLARKFV